MTSLSASPPPPLVSTDLDGSSGRHDMMDGVMAATDPRYQDPARKLPSGVFSPLQPNPFREDGEFFTDVAHEKNRRRFALDNGCKGTSSFSSSSSLALPAMKLAGDSPASSCSGRLQWDTTALAIAADSYGAVVDVDEDVEKGQDGKGGTALALAHTSHSKCIRNHNWDGDGTTYGVPVVDSSRSSSSSSSRSSSGEGEGEPNRNINTTTKLSSENHNHAAQRNANLPTETRVESDEHNGAGEEDDDDLDGVSDGEGDVYHDIRFSPWYGERINFREFHKARKAPQSVQVEPSVGLFFGQLPNSYSEDDIKAVLRAIADHAGWKGIQVRSVKSHGTDHTCAFVMINSGALGPILGYNKRVLCDINCLWVVEAERAHLLPQLVEQLPRQCLRGVPKAPVVLEKLVPQTRTTGGAAAVSSHKNHSSSAETTRGKGSGHNKHTTKTTTKTTNHHSHTPQHLLDRAACSKDNPSRRLHSLAGGDEASHQHDGNANNHSLPLPSYYSEEGLPPPASHTQEPRMVASEVSRGFSTVPTSSSAVAPMWMTPQSAPSLGHFTAAAWHGAVPLVGGAQWINAANPALFCPVTPSPVAFHPPVHTTTTTTTTSAIPNPQSYTVHPHSHRHDVGTTTSATTSHNKNNTNNMLHPMRWPASSHPPPHPTPSSQPQQGVPPPVYPHFTGVPVPMPPPNASIPYSENALYQTGGGMPLQAPSNSSNYPPPRWS